ELVIQPARVGACISPGDPDDGMAWFGEGGPEAPIVLIAARCCVKPALWILPNGGWARGLCHTIEVVADGHDIPAERVLRRDGDRERLTVRAFFVAVAFAFGRPHAEVSGGNDNHVRAGCAFLEEAGWLQGPLLARSEPSQRPCCNGGRFMRGREIITSAQ